MFYSHEIGRTCRSSVAAECIALANLMGVVLWVKTALTEILTGEFTRGKIEAADVFPLPKHFQTAGSGIDRPVGLEGEEELGSPVFLLAPMPRRSTVIKNSETGCIYFQHTCDTCQVNRMIPMTLLQKHYGSIYQSTSEFDIHCLVMTDCSNCFATINNVSIRCSEKVAKIQMSFIRDMLRLMTVSFTCGSFNLADLGAKQRGNWAIFKKLLETGYFELTFLTRKECRALLDSRRELKISNAWADDTKKKQSKK